MVRCHYVLKVRSRGNCHNICLCLAFCYIINFCAAERRQDSVYVPLVLAWKSLFYLLLGHLTTTLGHCWGDSTTYLMSIKHNSCWGRIINLSFYFAANFWENYFSLTVSENIFCQSDELWNLIVNCEGKNIITFWHSCLTNSPVNYNKIAEGENIKLHQNQVITVHAKMCEKVARSNEK